MARHSLAGSSNYMAIKVRFF